METKNNIIQQGAEAEFQIEVRRTDFDWTTCGLCVNLSWGYRGESICIDKDDMSFDDEGRYYFSFDTSEMMGWVSSECRYETVDPDDAVDGMRTNVDRQILCFVSSSPATNLGRCRKKVTGEKRYIQYTRMNGESHLYIGGGAIYTDVLTPEFEKEHGSVFTGEYEMSCTDSDKIFVIVPAERASQIVDIRMGGLSIPRSYAVHGDWAVWTSLNEYQAGDYIITINV